MKTVTVRLKDPGARWENEELGVNITGTQTVSIKETKEVKRAIAGKLLERVEDEDEVDTAQKVTPPPTTSGAAAEGDTDKGGRKK